jgi:beta-aspartyl-peptidase (threonine type)
MATNFSGATEKRSYRTGFVLFAVTTVVLLGVLGWQSVYGSLARTGAADEIRDVLTKQQDAWNKGDLDGFMAGYQMNEKITFYSGGDVMTGWVALRERYEKKYRSEGQKMGTLTFSDVVVDVLATDSALVRGRWKVERDGKTSSGLYTLLVRKFPDGWKVVHDHTSAAAS